MQNTLKRKINKPKNVPPFPVTPSPSSPPFPPSKTGMGGREGVDYGPVRKKSFFYAFPNAKLWVFMNKCGNKYKNDDLAELFAWILFLLGIRKFYNKNIKVKTEENRTLKERNINFFRNYELFLYPYILCRYFNKTKYLIWSISVFNIKCIDYYQYRCRSTYRHWISRVTYIHNNPVCMCVRVYARLLRPVL